MALRVWLPLNGTLENKGISDVTVVNNGATVEDNGKIGKCYHFNGSTYISGSRIDYTSLSTHFSISLWVKLYETVSSYTEILNLAPSAGWANIRFGMVIPQDSNVISCSVADGTDYLGNSFQTSPIPLNTWTHICFIYNNKNLELYINGNFLKSYSTSIIPDWENISTIGIGAAANGWEKSKSYINDVRIYDHVLSAKEVKEISQGLILHYKLNDNIQILDNCYSYPTFNISSGNGGWYHWGRSGHVGSQGQNTDKTYIYNKENTYSHWVSNGETATGEYLVYQSPAFDGGYRSLQAIIKEENSKPIDETICFPDWNARNGGTPVGLWTSIIPLGDGFYLCKCEGISQDGSNDLVGIFVKPGYKIYLSEAYLENDKEMCSEILYPRNYIIDSSGYGNNGIINGNLITDNNTSKYSSSTFFDGNTAAIKIPFNDIIKDKNYTVSCWTYKTTIGTKNYQTILGGPSGFELEARSGSNTSPLYRILNWGGGTTPYEFNKWNHFCFVHTDADSKLYVNGELKITGTSANIPTGNYFIGSWSTATSQNYEGQMSDFRLYATALSAEDILDLYHTPANVDNLGGIHGFELEDKKQNILFPACHVLTTKDWNTSILLRSYTQSNCQVTLTDDGLRIYRPANYNPTDNGSTMWGGMRLANTSDGNKHIYNNNDNPMGLQKGRTYIIIFKVKGKTSNAISNCGWTNQMGWGGGGLMPSPSNIEYDLIPANFDGEKICWYKWTINDDIVKTCTTSYSYATQGNQYMSYADFAFGWGYQDTGSMGSDIYITDIQMYNITDDLKQSILKNGVIQATAFWQESTSNISHFLKGGLINTNNFIEK